jgi:hypothetical protein
MSERIREVRVAAVIVAVPVIGLKVPPQIPSIELQRARGVREPSCILREVDVSVSVELRSDFGLEKDANTRGFMNTTTPPRVKK